MSRNRRSALFTVAIMAAFWAYTIMDSLIRQFAEGISYLDLGAIFVLGLITGIALGLVPRFRREESHGGTNSF